MAYQAELKFPEKPYQSNLIDDFNSDLEEGGLALPPSEGNDFSTFAYPKPPWTRSVSASGTGLSRPSAQALCQSDAKSKARKLENICRNNDGTPSSNNYPSCSTCNQLGSQWRCNANVRVRCSSSVEDIYDPAFILPREEEADRGLNSMDENTRLASPVFSDRQDCRAIAMNNPGLCRNRDCRGVLYHSQSYCQSNDCRAIVLGLVSYCQTRDCRAILYNNVGFCESSNCRAVIYKNYGMCR